MTSPMLIVKLDRVLSAALGASALFLSAAPAAAQPAAEPPSKAPAVPTELGDKTHAEITRLTDQGQALFDEGKLDEARGLFMQAWLLIPEPQSEWEATTWLAAAIGDIDFLKGRYADALDIRAADHDMPVKLLSGGNQQKVILARWLAIGFGLHGRRGSGGGFGGLTGHVLKLLCSAN